MPNFTPIPVHPAFGPMPVAPVLDVPTTRDRIKTEWRRQAAISLAKIKAGDPVGKDTHGRYA